MIKILLEKINKNNMESSEKFKPIYICINGTREAFGDDNHAMALTIKLVNGFYQIKFFDPNNSYQTDVYVFENPQHISHYPIPQEIKKYFAVCLIEYNKPEYTSQFNKKPNIIIEDNIRENLNDKQNSRLLGNLIHQFLEDNNRFNAFFDSYDYLSLFKNSIKALGSNSKSSWINHLEKIIIEKINPSNHQDIKFDINLISKFITEELERLLLDVINSKVKTEIIKLFIKIMKKVANKEQFSTMVELISDNILSAFDKVNVKINFSNLMEKKTIKEKIFVNLRFTGNYVYSIKGKTLHNIKYSIQNSFNLDSFQVRECDEITKCIPITLCDIEGKNHIEYYYNLNNNSLINKDNYLIIKKDSIDNIIKNWNLDA